MSHWHHKVADPLAQDLLMRMMVKLMMRMMRLVIRMMARLVNGDEDGDQDNDELLLTTVIEMMATLRSPSNVSRLSWRDRYSCSYASSCATFDHSLHCWCSTYCIPVIF